MRSGLWIAAALSCLAPAMARAELLEVRQSIFGMD
jgi:hypothetical protein